MDDLIAQVWKVETLDSDEWRWMACYQVPVAEQVTYCGPWQQFNVFQCRLEPGMYAYQFFWEWPAPLYRMGLSMAVFGFGSGADAHRAALQAYKTGTIAVPVEGSAA